MRFDKAFVRNFFLYGVIGSTCALLDFSLFTLMYQVAGLNEYVANAISIHIGIATSFILNSRFNFKKTDRLAFRAIAFYATGLFGLALSQGLLWLGDTLSVPVITAKIISIFVVAIVQFTLNRIIAFGK